MKKKDKRGNSQFVTTGENEKNIKKQDNDWDSVTNIKKAKEKNFENGYIFIYFINYETAEFLSDELFRHRLE